MIKTIQKIENLLEKIEYKEVYIEIKTEKDKYIIEKSHKTNRIGF